MSRTRDTTGRFTTPTQEQQAATAEARRIEQIEAIHGRKRKQPGYLRLDTQHPDPQRRRFRLVDNVRWHFRPDMIRGAACGAIVTPDHMVGGNGDLTEAWALVECIECREALWVEDTRLRAESTDL